MMTLAPDSPERRAVQLAELLDDITRSLEKLVVGLTQVRIDLDAIERTVRDRRADNALS